MAHKSHRQKALASQLEAQPEISLVTPLPSTSTSTSRPANAAASASGGMDVDDDEVMIGSAPSASSSAQATSSGFAPLSSTATSGVLKNEFRRVPIPAHRFSPLKRDWVTLYTPLVENLGLQVRMNQKRRCVEMRTSEHTVDTGAVQKGADFVKAYALGFDVNVSPTFAIGCLVR